MDMIINDFCPSVPFLVYSVSAGRVIFSMMDASNGGDVPPDVAMLPVLRTFTTFTTLVYPGGPVIQIDVP